MSDTNSTELPDNLIDLGQYPRNDVELITREYMRHAYLETLNTFIKDYSSLDETDQSRQNIITTLESFEHTIAVLDGSEEFLEAVHSSADVEEESEDKEFERF
tara:strand:- start:571 stop:879 length:309 start_codon:yes stop_codon:yes gene_type:complete